VKPVIVNLVAIVLSAVALATSTYIAFQHQALQKAANFTPAYLHLLKQFQTMEFHDHYRYVTTRLKTEHDPKLGVAGLPDDARRAVYDVAYFFQGYGILCLLRILDDQVLPTMQLRSISVWEAIEPYVERERKLFGYGELHYLRAFEEFAKDVKVLPPGSLNTKLTRRRFIKIQRGLTSKAVSTSPELPRLPTPDSSVTA
jgi:hypothetical protein